MLNPVDMLTNYTYLQALLGTVIVGACAGALGPLVFLRRQPLLADAISHSSLPGLVAVFVVTATIGLDGRNTAALTIGAVITGAVAVAAITWLPQHTRLKTDAVMAATLTTFFSIGMLLLQYVSRQPLPGKAGIQDYLLGNASTLTRSDVLSSLVFGVIALAALAAVHHKLALSVFDPAAHRSLGPLTFLVLTVVAVIGIKVAGVVLMVAVIIAPAAAARQWVHRLPPFIALSAGLGVLAAVLGAYCSVVWSLPTGPVITVVLALITAGSLLKKKVLS